MPTRKKKPVLSKGFTVDIGASLTPLIPTTKQSQKTLVAQVVEEEPDFALD